MYKHKYVVSMKLIIFVGVKVIPYSVKTIILSIVCPGKALSLRYHHGACILMHLTLWCHINIGCTCSANLNKKCFGNYLKQNGIT